MSNETMPGNVPLSDGLGLLPERAGQADVMTLTGIWTATEERGHWYSPAAVRKMLSTAREGCAKICESRIDPREQARAALAAAKALREGSMREQIDRLSRPWWQNSAVLRSLFPPALKPGDVMLFDDKAANPFKDPPHRVVVKATQGDWVNYRWETGWMLQNESMRRRTFACCYVKA